MKRSEFLSWVALTQMAGLVKFENGTPEPVSEEAEEKIQGLHDALYNREPVELFGMEFYIYQASIDHDGFDTERKTITLELVSNGIFNNAIRR
jgi:hypothetical protein